MNRSGAFLLVCLCSSSFATCFYWSYFPAHLKVNLCRHQQNKLTLKTRRNWSVTYERKWFIVLNAIIIVFISLFITVRHSFYMLYCWSFFVCFFTLKNTTNCYATKHMSLVYCILFLRHTTSKRVTLFIYLFIYSFNLISRAKWSSHLSFPRLRQTSNRITFLFYCSDVSNLFDLICIVGIPLWWRYFLILFFYSN